MKYYPIYEVADLVENLDRLENEFNYKNCAFHDWDLLSLNIANNELFLSVISYDRKDDLVVEFKLTDFVIQDLKLELNKIKMENIGGIGIAVDENKKINFAVSLHQDENNYQIKIKCEKISVNDIKHLKSNQVVPFLHSIQIKLNALLYYNKND
ncbi:MAG: hypothetical protein PHH71_03115 [Clostridia bacterium]|nr:hypothetical protein [Clostridia bacterium]MDD3232103.1 hypothetical protein [Clostridia bacterium]MDD4408743.1 hypothetical protein [Clostridia bacterium]